MRAFGEGIAVVFVLSVLVIWFGTWLANRDRFPWPDAETLAAGDEDLLVEPFPDGGCDLILNPRQIARLRAANDDGHLEDDDHWRRHPDGS